MYPKSGYTHFLGPSRDTLYGQREGRHTLCLYTAGRVAHSLFAHTGRDGTLFTRSGRGSTTVSRVLSVVRRQVDGRVLVGLPEEPLEVRHLTPATGRHLYAPEVPVEHRGQST